MPPSSFRRTDLRHLASALSAGESHGGLDMFDASWGLNTTGGNKDQRATAIVRAIFNSADATSELLGLLNHLYVDSAGAEYRMGQPAFRTLTDNVLSPLGIVLTDNGFAFSADDSNQGSTNRTAMSPSSPTTAVRPTATPAAPPASAQTPAQAQVVPDATEGQRHTVFLVHGRDMRPVEVLHQFLMFHGLRVMPWSEAVRLTGSPQPHTYDIVKAGMDHSAAIIVVFSPDDLARVSDAFSEPDDPDRVPQGQPRQNVTLEAGLAFGIARDKTIFVKSAPTRDISDIDGFNWVKLDGEYDSRADLRERLRTAGADLRPQSDNLLHPHAGPFKVL